MIISYNNKNRRENATVDYEDDDALLLFFRSKSDSVINSYLTPHLQQAPANTHKIERERKRELAKKRKALPFATKIKK